MEKCSSDDPLLHCRAPHAEQSAEAVWKTTTMAYCNDPKPSVAPVSTNIFIALSILANMDIMCLLSGFQGRNVSVATTGWKNIRHTFTSGSTVRGWSLLMGLDVLPRSSGSTSNIFIGLPGSASIPPLLVLLSMKGTAMKTTPTISSRGKEFSQREHHFKTTWYTSLTRIMYRTHLALLHYAIALLTMALLNVGNSARPPIQ
jgi:hypothetical protein